MRPNLSALRFVHNFPLISAPVIQVILPGAGVPLGSDIQPVVNGSPTREHRHLEPCRLNVASRPQIFKIIAPFVFLSAAFATLNARLGMPPFALFLVALCLTDGARAI